MFSYNGGKDDQNMFDSNDSYDEYRPKKRKAKGKTLRTNKKKQMKLADRVEVDQDAKRLVPLGVSVFDLIMPWKNDIQK